MNNPTSDDRKDDDSKAENETDKSKTVTPSSDGADEHILIAKNVENIEQSYVFEKETSDIIVVQNIIVKNCDGVIEIVVETLTSESKNVPQQLKAAPKRHISTNDEPVAPKKTYVIDSRYYIKRSERINSDDEDDCGWGYSNPYGGIDEMGNYHEPGSPY
uniref:Uncharacterized protein n=1 Tax=Panagrolaimus davidi TaxID=227884 RepID=A0A914QTF0_9BILA